MKNKNYNRNPGGHNQWKLRSDEEIQKIIDKHPTWTKKDFRGEGKLNPNKKSALLTRKETERNSLKFYQIGKRSNIKKIIKHSTSNSIREFKSGKIDFYILRNRASTKQIRDNMSVSEKRAYDKEIYENLTDKQKEKKNERNRKYYKNMSVEQRKNKKKYDRIAAKKRWKNITDEEWEIKKERDREYQRRKREEEYYYESFK